MISIYAAVRDCVHIFGIDTVGDFTGILVLAWFVATLVGLIYPPALVFWSNEKSRKRVLAFSVWALSLLVAFGFPGTTDYSLLDQVDALAGLFLILTLLALIFPWIVTPWSTRTSRKDAAGLCAIIMIVLAVGVNALGAYDPVDPRYALTEEEFESASPERQIMFLAALELRGESAYVKDIAVTGHPSGGYIVEVNLREESYDFPFLQQPALSTIMQDIYKAVYTSGHDVRDAGISVYTPTPDGGDELLWKTAVEKSDAEHIDWREQYPTCTGPQYGLDLDEYTVYKNEEKE